METHLQRVLCRSHSPTYFNSASSWQFQLSQSLLALVSSSFPLYLPRVKSLFLNHAVEIQFIGLTIGGRERRLAIDKIPSSSTGEVDIAGLWLICFRKTAYHRFLTAHDVRPGSISAMSVHRLPSRSRSRKINPSSHGSNGPFLRPGLIRNIHRSRHCVAVRPITIDETESHWFVPYFLTAVLRSSSSEVFQFPWRIVEVWGVCWCDSQVRSDGGVATSVVYPPEDDW
jgi:hypothetical protein